MDKSATVTGTIDTYLAATPYLAETVSASFRDDLEEVLELLGHIDLTPF